MAESKLHILGIRHHVPGSARSVRRALDGLSPDCVLIEGPPDANELIPFVAREELKPPVAILVHDASEPKDAVYYPFAEFSPEWQALKWATAKNVPVRFIDLPQLNRLAVAADDKKEDEEAAGEDDNEPPLPPSPMRRDPLQQLAHAAGFDDGERWWEHVVESRATGGTEIFAAIKEAMSELRQADTSNDLENERREAHMRREMRVAIKAGHTNIVVICGAWHAPALDLETHPAKADDATLKGLPKLKTAATWVPWTYDRLAYTSGYGAGVHSPGWYEHLWKHAGGAVVETWMTRVARLLREKDIDCSSAHVIEAVRLSSSLAAMRGRPLADLSDIADATRSIFCFDSDMPMQLIARELLVGDRLGELPDDVPMVPLQQDLLATQKRLRLKPEAQDKPLDLDLRNDNDRQRSVLLHRLRLLGVHWGTPAHSASKGTFREAWRIAWAPEFAVALIDAARYGNTVGFAAGGKLSEMARKTDDLAHLVDFLQDALLSDLGDAAPALVQRIENVAAVSSDLTLLMRTLPPLASLLRYGNVRDTDETMVRAILDGTLPRISIGLGAAVSSLNDEAADAMEKHLNETDAAVALVDAQEHTDAWRDALARIIDQPSVHGLIRGRCVRLLLDAGRLENDAVGQRLSQTLSRGNDPAQGARWLEGFLRGSGLLLLHDPKLLKLIDDWVAEIDGEVFHDLLPLLRRTFSTLPVSERRQLGAKLKKPDVVETTATEARADFDHERAAKALPILLQLLGAKS